MNEAIELALNAPPSPLVAVLAKVCRDPKACGTTRSRKPDPPVLAQTALAISPADLTPRRVYQSPPLSRKGRRLDPPPPSAGRRLIPTPLGHVEGGARTEREKARARDRKCMSRMLARAWRAYLSCPTATLKQPAATVRGVVVLRAVSP